MTQATYPNRARQTVVLKRLDLDGPTHTNPDGEELPCPHVHVYRDGFGTKWACYALPVTYPAVGTLAETVRRVSRRHNDALQIFVRRSDTGFVLTDDGYIIRDLALSGCSLDTPKRKDLLQTTLNGFGVRLNGDALEVSASPDAFPRGKHNLIQSMLAINDMFYLAKPMVENLFLEDVMAWLDLNEIRYTPNVKFTGITGYDHLFHFVIPKSKLQPERIVQAIDRPSKETVQVFIQEWTDTQRVRAPESKAYTLLNDDENIAGGVTAALSSYRIKPVLWSQRAGVAEELAA